MITPTFGVDFQNADSAADYDNHIPNAIVDTVYCGEHLVVDVNQKLVFRFTASNNIGLNLFAHRN